MAKFHGVIGYVRTEETAPSVHTEVSIERPCYGDVIRNTQRWETRPDLNDSPAISNLFSIVGDDYAMENLGSMRYIKWKGVPWKIASIEIQRPRLILTVGGVYNGQTN